MNDAIETFRDLVPSVPGTVELNAGTLSPTPTPIMERVAELRRLQASSPSDFFFHHVGPLTSASRAALARFLNASTHDLFLLPNVTTALNVALQSVRLAQGDVILTTDQEYGAMRYVLDHLARRDGASLRVIPIDHRTATVGSIVEAFRGSLDDRVKLVFFSHVSSPTGLRLPACEIVAAVRREDRVVVIDGAHGPGAIEVDLAAIGADAYAANCHKWMMAPCGAGFLHATGRFKQMLRPLVRSWGDAFDAATSPEGVDEPMVDATWKLDFGATKLQYAIEYMGVYDRTPQMVLGEVIALIERIGPGAREQAWRGLGAYAREKLCGIGLRCASPADEALRSPMTIFDVTPAEADRIRQRLWRDHRVFAPVTSARGELYLRVSTAWFNTRQQVDRLALVLPGVLGR